jgi:hypothetical protein
MSYGERDPSQQIDFTQKARFVQRQYYDFYNDMHKAWHNGIYADYGDAAPTRESCEAMDSLMVNVMQYGFTAPMFYAHDPVSGTALTPISMIWRSNNAGRENRVIWVTIIPNTSHYEFKIGDGTGHGPECLHNLHRSNYPTQQGLAPLLFETLISSFKDNW